VQRQYSGTAGRTENCQIGTFLAYASARGRATGSRTCPPSGSTTANRRAGVPDHVEFATKPQQAQQMIARAIAAGVPFRWLTAEEACGQGRQLRSWLEQHEVFLRAGDQA
jgi:SRSO17 transposase